MFTFIDAMGVEVSLTFQRHIFTIPSKHVLILPYFQKQWVLTKHPKRGLEFPGGKVEEGETVKEAAGREVFEETGCIVKELIFIGEYMVKDASSPFVKTIFFAKVERMDVKDHYEETLGPILKSSSVFEELDQPIYSFIMKDQVIPCAFSRIQQLNLIKESGSTE